MSEGAESDREPVGTRMRLPCGHRWTMPWGLAPEAAAAELLRHQQACDRDPGIVLFSGARPAFREP